MVHYVSKILVALFVIAFKLFISLVVTFPFFHDCSGLKEYIGANPALKFEASTTVVHSKISDISVSNTEYEDTEVPDEFYDAIASDSSSEDEESDHDNDAELDKKVFLLFI